MSAVEKIIGRLSRVMPAGPDKWKAACPLCQSRNGRPIAIRAVPDGRVMLYAFCQCDTGDVLSAIGLRFSDLYPEQLGHHFAPERRSFDPLQVLQAVAHEVIVANLIVSEMVESGRGDTEQASRLRMAGQRLTTALSLIGETPVPDEIKRIRRAEVPA